MHCQLARLAGIALHWLGSLHETSVVRASLVVYFTLFSSGALVTYTYHGLLTPDALAVIEVHAREASASPAGFAVLDERSYGAARLVFLRATSALSETRAKDR